MSAPVVPAAAVGLYRHTLDAKGRLVLPAAHRAMFSEGGYATRWTGPCIALLPPAEFMRWAEVTRRQVLTSTVDDPAKVLRRLFHRTQAFKVDIQGRLVVPDDLRQAVGIDRDVVVAGTDLRVELWAPGDHDDDADDQESTIELLQSAFDLQGRG